MTRTDWVLLAAATAFAVAIAGAATEGGRAEPLPADATWRAPDGRTIPQLIAAHVLPDPAKTPGVLNSTVTMANLKTNVCVPNWTATVRPPTSYTSKLRAAGAPPGVTPALGELDHLISIEDGGDPRDPKNLWWMVYADRYGARVKDVLETKLHRLLCAGKITLADAQAALSPNWLTGSQRYVGPLP